MSEQAQGDEILGEVTETTKAMESLAQDEKAFEEAISAFRAQNAQAFQAALERRGLRQQCRLICQWICSKECIRICLLLCGPPPAEVPGPAEIRQYAQLVARIGADRGLLTRFVEAVEKENRQLFEQLVKELQIERYCHFLCRWLCGIRCRLACEVVCAEGPRQPFLQEVEEASVGIRQLVENQAAFAKAVEGADALNCPSLRSVITEARLPQYCFWICEWFCSWRCVRLCLTLCRPFPLTDTQVSIAEMRAFAQAIARLEGAVLQRLVGAVARQDEKLYEELVRQQQLERFCIQFCHWVCFLYCREFCICVCPPGGLLPDFTSIGALDYSTDVHSGLGGSGLTVADNRAFFSTLRLNGVLPQLLGGSPMEYRFEVQPTDASGNPTGGWTPVMRNQIAPTEIGHWEHFPPLQSGKYTVNNPTPGPTERVATISADGWIQVPQENDVLSPAGAFSSNGNMINLITSTLASWGAVDQTGVLAGSSSTSNGSSLAQDRYFGIRMMVRQVGDLSNGSPAGTCVHIAIDDTTYNNVLHQPNWRHQLDPPGDLAVALVDIAELVAHPCAEIADKLTVLFTAAHPNLGAVSLSMVGPGGPYSFDMHPDGAATPQNFFGTATLHAPPTVSQLKPCAYLVTLEIQVLLTTGDAVPSDVFDQVAFCKG